MDFKFWRATGLASAMVLFPVSVLAEEDTIIVEGLRLPTPRAEAGSSISIITAADIEARGYSFLLDAVAFASGVTINQNGAFGGAASVRIRGAASGQTLVLLDGVPLGDPTGIDGGYDFSIFDTVDVERVEVLKGPQSTLWGADAIGGVINIISKTPEEGLAGRLFVEGGSFGTARAGISLSGIDKRGDFRVGISGITTDGISKADEEDGNSEEDGYDGLTVSGRAGWNYSDDLRIEGALRYMKGDVDIDGFTFSTSGFALGDTADTSKSEQFTGNLSLRADTLDGALSHILMAGYTDIERIGNFGGFEQNDTGERSILRYQGTLNLNQRNRVAFGAEREESKSESNGLALGKTDITGLFALYEVKPVQALTLSAGLRNDDHSEFGSETTARVAAALRINDRIALRGSWGEGFKAPTIFQLTQSFGPLPPNSALRPETSEAFDLGVDYRVGAASVSLTYFNRDTANEIIFDPDFRYSNLDATKAEGVEVSFETTLTEAISVSADYAFIDAKDKVTGARQIRIPQHSGDIALSYDRGDAFSGSIIVRYNGAETEGAFGLDLASWTRVDLAASYALAERLAFYGRVENLLDEDYQQVSGFGTPGLSAYLGLRLELHG